MPLSITNTAGGSVHGNPFVGPINHTAHVKVDISGLTTKEVDAYGYLKPGVPLKQNGALVGSGTFVFGVTMEAAKLNLAVVPPTDSSLSSETGDLFVAVGTVGQVSQDIIEDNLGRALTADELAGFDVAGSKVVLIRT
ncbi:MAG TPA: hypothetical protein VIX17_11455 [Pyrinomonadaceae bacterium]|jgi:hypothetical protein